MRVRPVLAVAALAAAATALAVAVGGSGDGYAVRADLVSSGQIVVGNDVRIGAQTVGHVAAVRLTRDGLAGLVLDIDGDHAPLREGTGVAVRATSLTGAANRYVVLSLPAADQRTPIPDGGLIRSDDTTPLVDFESFVDVLDRPTRAGVRALIRGNATAVAGRSRAAGRALRRLAPALTGTTAVMAQISRDEPALRGLLGDGARAFAAVRSRDAQLTRLVDDAGTAAAAFGDEAGGVRDALDRLPGTLRRSTATFGHLRSTLDAVGPLVATAKPATRRLDRFLSGLQPVLRESRTVLPRLARTARRPGADDDLVDLLERLPVLARTSRRALPRAIRTMDRSQADLDLLRADTPDVVASLGNLGQAASYYDANGHYVRAMPVMSALAYDADANRLTAKPASARLAGFQRAVRRCPGAALPARADGSAPIPVAGCRPETTQVGP